MNALLVLTLFCVIFHLASAPPPRRGDVDKKKEEKHEKDEVEDFGLEYNRYLKEVVDLLESDPEFKRKLEDAQEADIRSGKIAQELEYVDHKVRTKLDEVKRQEIERLRHLAQKEFELTNGIDTKHIKISAEHLDHENPHTFELEDLRKLIAQVSADLVKADEKRKQEFKEYEMQKEFEKQERLKHLSDAEKEAFKKQIQENETKHKQHEPLHHPGSKQQLEEVWQKQDHMENEKFDPKVFFQLHDLDGNGAWDHNEVKALFLKELDKMYQQGAPEDDMRERAEEMERMREHVFGEADKNKDGLISYDEFLDKTKQQDFDNDPGWESIDEKPAFTYEEYKEFERKRQEEVQRLIAQGLIPPQPVYDPQYGYYHPPPPPPGYGGVHPQYHQPQAQPHIPQGHINQHAQGFNPNLHQVNQMHQNEIPHTGQQQFQPNHPQHQSYEQNQQHNQQYQQNDLHQQFQNNQHQQQNDLHQQFQNNQHQQQQFQSKQNQQQQQFHQSQHASQFQNQEHHPAPQRNNQFQQNYQHPNEVNLNHPQQGQHEQLDAQKSHSRTFQDHSKTGNPSNSQQVDVKPHNSEGSNPLPGFHNTGTNQKIENEVHGNVKEEKHGSQQSFDNHL